MSSYGELGTFTLKDCISCIAFSPNGDYFAAGGLDEKFYLWYIRSHQGTRNSNL